MRGRTSFDVIGEGSAAASALVQSTLLGELLEHAQIGALAVESGRYVAANEYACELTGYDRSELIGRGIGELHPLSAELLNRRHDGVVKMRRKDGSEIEVGFRVVDTTLSGLPLFLTLFARA
ncbi:MAG: PAS domain S-box protein [Thermoleophilia bacterium]|nr:PAS domain S-box protein [Thermoleophilia bacterium]